jgi:transglutaminase-like putative cysteine protease
MQEYHTLLGRDAGVAMLVLLVAFKTLEMHARRDLFVVVFLCFFLVLTNFFYSQSIGTGLVMLASVLALITTQISFQFTGAVPPLRARLLMGLRVLAFAAPLALLLFVGFPRIQGPLWGMPGEAGSGHGGLSDKMAPGQLSHLAQSEDTAFRVKFYGPPPAQTELYWRGPVLGAFDGQTWTRVRSRVRYGEKQPLALSVQGRPVRYEVTLEPSASRWLFALEMADQVPEVPGNVALVTGQFELTSAYPVQQRVRYALSSYTRFHLQASEVDNPAQWLLLPGGRNPRALAEGRLLANEPDPMTRVKTVLRRFSRENFVYTLDPPLLPGADSIDDFLYGSRAGFCEHYAGSFVFLMRAAGVPARVVTGYQGGEMNPIDGYVTVRQSDAHAWAEVWLAGRGWVRVDPTAAVSPERIRRGLARALPPPAPFGIEGLGRLMQLEAGNGTWFAQVRYAMGAVNNGWNQWVLNYSPERQRGVLASVQERLFDWRTGAALAVLCVVIIFAEVLRRRSRLHPVDALYSALCKRLAQLGLPRAIDEGPDAFAARVAASSLAPQRQAAATEFLHRYSKFRYARHPHDPALASILKRLLSQLR